MVWDIECKIMATFGEKKWSITLSIDGTTTVGALKTQIKSKITEPTAKVAKVSFEKTAVAAAKAAPPAVLADDTKTLADFGITAVGAGVIVALCLLDKPVVAATPAAATATETKKAAAGPSASDMEKYGTHVCTCDGCTANPIVGFRYKCTKCPDHDICENCYERFRGGILPHENKLNNVNRDVLAHEFKPFVDGKKFTGMLAKKQQATAPKKKKCGPNDTCECGSGKKYKKCCQAKDAAAAAAAAPAATPAH